MNTGPHANDAKNDAKPHAPGHEPADLSIRPHRMVHNRQPGALIVTTEHKTRLWGPAEVSEYLGISVNTLYQWRTRNYGPPARRVGRHLRYRPADVVAWFESLDPEVV